MGGRRGGKEREWVGRIGVEREGVGGKDRGGKRGSGWEG